MRPRSKEELNLSFKRKSLWELWISVQRLVMICPDEYVPAEATDVPEDVAKDSDVPVDATKATDMAFDKTAVTLKTEPDAVN